MSGSEHLWQETYEAKNPEELSQAYKKWAPMYEHDTVKRMGYVAPTMASRLLDNYLESQESSIMDAGCGTGLVGKALTELGYSKLEAMDYCEHMLAEADKKNIYGNMMQVDMNQPLEIPDNSYDASICVGAFTYAHLGPDAFNELARITRPEGFVCFTVRDGAYQQYGYRARMLEMEHLGVWELQEMIHDPYLVDEKVTAKFCLYKVLEG